MAKQHVTAGARDPFGEAARSIANARLRPEIRLTEVPAPTRIAPEALALTCDVVDPHDADEDLATGRFVLLHDTSCPEPWEGAWRVVTFARASLDPELASDPVLADVGWSWLTEALDDAHAQYTAAAGTVTCVTSQGFGGLADNGSSVEMEIRASWTPTSDADLQQHLVAWSNLLCTIAGLEPLPEGVVALPTNRR